MKTMIIMKMMENTKLIRQAILTVSLCFIAIASAFGQGYKDAFRVDICDCIADKTQGDHNVLKASYMDCITKLMPKYAASVDASIPDTTAIVKLRIGQKRRHALIVNYEIELLNTCESYFEMFEKGREDQLRRIKYDANTIDKMTERIAMSPNQIHYMQRGITYLGKGDYQAAISDLNATLEFNPKDLNALLYKGWALEKQGEFREATVVYKSMKYSNYDVQSITLQTIAMHKAGSDVYLTNDDLWYAPEANESKITKSQTGTESRRSRQRTTASRTVTKTDSTQRGISSKEKKSIDKKKQGTKKPVSDKKLRSLFDLKKDGGS